jgi:Zn-dependent protease
MNAIRTIIIWALPVLFAITLHEVAHGWVAKKFGDTTAQSLGRLSFNPIKHIDPIGTILVPIVLIIVTGFGFGWAKPVPVNFNRLLNPKRDMIWVAAAGPFSNLFMALGWAAIMKFGFVLSGQSEWISEPMILMGKAGIIVNLVLFLLNLIPIPPLDGGRILLGLVPIRFSDILSRIEPIGMFLVFGLLAMGVLSLVLNPPLQFLVSLIGKIYGLPI